MFTTIKGYLYAALAAALLVGFLWYRSHEQNIGVQKEATKVTAVATKAQAKVTAGAVIAQTTETENGQKFTAAIAAPAPKPLGIVCHNDSRDDDQVPEAVGVVATRIGVPASDSGSGPGYDPSGAALERAREADAEIAYLQGRVHELEQQMVNSP